VQKALAARVPVIAAVSAPSTLAAEFAEQSGQTLVGFLRECRLNVYANPQRVRFPGQAIPDAPSSRGER
jgi:FdhD protein